MGLGADRDAGEARLNLEGTLDDLFIIGRAASSNDARLPHAWLLLPGVGAQGGKVADLAAAFDRRGLGALVNQSRGVMQAFAPDDARWLDKIDGAAAAFAAECLAVARHAAHA